MDDGMVKEHIAELRTAVASVRCDLDTIRTKVETEHHEKLMARKDILKVKESYSQLVQLSQTQNHQQMIKLQDMFEVLQRSLADRMQEHFQHTLHKVEDQERCFQSILQKQEDRFTAVLEIMQSNGQRAQSSSQSSVAHVVEHPEHQQKFKLPESLEANSVTLAIPNVEPINSNHERVAVRTDVAYCEYALGETVWDASLLLWTQSAKFNYHSSLILIGTIVLNAVVQLYFCWILLNQNDFSDPNVFTEMLGVMKTWRMQDGNDADRVSLGDMSLLSRVCGLDASLSIASAQVEELARIQSYLGLGPDDFELNGWAPGAELCLLCMLIFVLLIVSDARKLGCFVAGICSLPHAKTEIHGDKVLGLSSLRVFLLIILSCVRLVIDASLLVVGLTWLASTSSMVDLMLNAAALCFVIEIDEILFETLVPSDLGSAVISLEPLRFKGSSFKIEATLPIVFAGLVLVVLYTTRLVPNMEDMLAVKREACRGNRDFIGVRNVHVGLTFARLTIPYTKEAHSNFTSNYSPIFSEVRDARIPIKFLQHSVWLGSETALFEDVATGKIEKTSHIVNSFCGDLDEVPEGDDRDFLTVFFIMIRNSFGSHKGVSLSERPFKCAEYADFCDLDKSAMILRTICPITCGCHDPTSGRLHASPEAGCPGSCVERQREVLKSLPCIDVDPNSSAAWQSLWTQFENGYRHQRQFEDGLGDFVASMLSEGCDAHGKIPQNFKSMMSACERTDFMKLYGLTSVLGYCPSYCCRELGRVSTTECPVACLTSRVE